MNSQIKVFSKRKGISGGSNLNVAGSSR